MHVTQVFHNYLELIKHSKQNQDEFAVVAAIFLECVNNEAYSHIVSTATGTKCVGVEQCASKLGIYILKDLHAEVVAKRAFQRYIYKCIALLHQDASIQNNDAFPFQFCEHSYSSLGSSGNRNSNNADNSYELSSDSHLKLDRLSDDQSLRIPNIQLKSNWRVRLFITDSPCGDASIYTTTTHTTTATASISKTSDGNEIATQNIADTVDTICSGKQISSILKNKNILVDSAVDTIKLAYTGAKLVQPHTMQKDKLEIIDTNICKSVSTDDKQSNKPDVNSINLPTSSSLSKSSLPSTFEWIRESHHQILGQLRLKSGRSDIHASHRTTAKSCTDKICKWICVGLQGNILSTLCEPIYLSSIHILQDPYTETTQSQYNAIQRGILHRIHMYRDPPITDNNKSSHCSTPSFTQQVVHMPSIHIIPYTDLLIQENSSTCTSATITTDSTPISSHNLTYSTLHGFGKNLSQFVVEHISSSAPSTSVSQEISNAHNTVDKQEITSSSRNHHKTRIKLRPSGTSLNWIVIINSLFSTSEHLRNTDENVNSQKLKRLSTYESDDIHVQLTKKSKLNDADSNVCTVITNNLPSSSSSSNSIHTEIPEVGGCNQSYILEREDYVMYKHIKGPICGGSLEVLQSHNGIVLGTTKKNEGKLQYSSRLSRAHMSQLYSQIIQKRYMISKKTESLSTSNQSVSDMRIVQEGIENDIQYAAAESHTQSGPDHLSSPLSSTVQSIMPVDSNNVSNLTACTIEVPYPYNTYGWWKHHNSVYIQRLKAFKALDTFQYWDGHADITTTDTHVQSSVEQVTTDMDIHSRHVKGKTSQINVERIRYLFDINTLEIQEFQKT